MTLADMRRAWKELAAVGDAELVTVESEDENVRVARKGDLVQVFVDHKPRARKAEAGPEKAGKAAAASEGAEEVRVEVPVSLVDALLSGQGDTVNIQAAISQLNKLRGDIVRVRDEETSVRVWIDDRNTQATSAAR
jgi:hypothetical protein